MNRLSIASDSPRKIRALDPIDGVYGKAARSVAPCSESGRHISCFRLRCRCPLHGLHITAHRGQNQREKAVQKRKLGNSDLEVSAIGLVAWG
jgi:hypothetical protein